MFCLECKSLLVPRNGKLACECGYVDDSRIIVKEKVEKQKIIEVIDEKDEHIGDDKIPLKCWNCGFVGVYFRMVQMRRSDEPPTRFYKCKKCKKVWRSGK